MIPKATENTITSILAEELQKLGIKTEPFARIKTPTGDREPDILCKNSGSYPIEAKFSETQLVEAIAKLQNEYIRHYDILGVEGGFALLYPKELAEPMPPEAVRTLAHELEFKLVAIFSPKDPRPFRVDKGNLDEIVRVLGEYVLKPTKPIEPTIDFIIKSLRESATYLRNGLRYVSAPDLEGFFGGRGVFENILQYEEKEYPIEELKSAAAFILVNQLLFYQVLSKMRPQFKDIDPDKIRKPSDLKDYFDKVLEINYRPVFFYDVTPYIPESFVDQVKLIVNVVKGLSVEKVGGDFLGTIFHDLIPFETRKSVAAFYTNVLAAELLASLSIDDPNAQVADLAVGSGGLLVAAYRRKKGLLKESFTEAKHRIFVGADLLGIDVMPFAASVAASHLALQSPQYFTNRVRIAVWDSTDLKPGRIIPSAAGLRQVLEGQTYLDSFAPVSKRRVKGVVEVGEGDVSTIQLNSCDVVIMNPPFTRQERIPEDYKALLAERFGNYKEYLHGQLGYHGYFILLADRFLKDGGKMALVLPATVLRVKSYEGIRKLLAENYHIEHIITTSRRSAFSESTMFREILLVAKKSTADKDAKTIVTVLKKLPRTLVESREMAKAIKRTKEDWEDDKMIVKVHDYSKLKSDFGNWFSYIVLKNAWLRDFFYETIQKGNKKTILLQKYLEEIQGSMDESVRSRRGGIAPFLFLCSSREKMLKKEDVWLITDRTKQSLKVKNVVFGSEFTIPINALQPGLRRTAGLATMDVWNKLDWIITSDFPGFNEFTALSSRKMSENFLPNWKKYVLGRMGKVAPIRRADLSAPGTRLLAYYSRIRFAPGPVLWALDIPKDKDSIFITLWFNSSLNLLQSLINRSETRGAFIELGKYMLEKFYVLNPLKLSQQDKEILLEVFEKIKTQEFPSLLNQLKTKNELRYLIDKAIMKVLGFDEREIESVLPRLYEALAEEIQLLKKMMAEGSAVD